MRTTTLIQRVEGAAIAAVAAIVFVQAGFAWWWLLAIFLVFDLSIVGYAAGPRIGAATYNAAHSYVAPAIVVLVAITAEPEWARFLAPAWLFHIGVDRAAGYGLKHPDAFDHTHLDD